MLIEKESIKIPLSQGLFAIVDSGAPPDVFKYKWYADKKANGIFYARNNEVGYLHRFIVKPQKGMVIDHKNGNSLDNRMSNLRECKQAENVINQPASSKNTLYKGVHCVGGKTTKYRAVITLNKERHYLGLYEDPKEAAKAYNEAAKTLHGSFARLNNI